jgi:short subunit dehydrogenase-like uncharacterized protein
MAVDKGLDWQTVSMDQVTLLHKMAASVNLVLNAAGPFSATSRPLVEACLAAGTHYADVSGEVQSIEAAASSHGRARQRDVMVMPGVGFDVVPSDCLAAHTASRLPGADTLRIGLEGLSQLSRGSAKTIVEQLGVGVWTRRDGKLVAVAPGTLTHHFDYGAGSQPSLAVSWGDVSTAFFSTGIPNIEVYFSATVALRASLVAARAWGWLLSAPPWQALLKHNTRWLQEGPSEAERRAATTTIVAEVTRRDGGRACSRLRTPGVYELTAAATVAIAERVLAGDARSGFQTPSRVYGADFVMSLEGVSREDL